jgi:hypothetical protein
MPSKITWIHLLLKEWKMGISCLVGFRRRLTSPFTLHWTLNQILETFSGLPDLQDALAKATGMPIKRKHRYSFFEDVPELVSCDEMGIPDEFCVCHPLDEVSLSDLNLHLAAVKAVNTINSDLLNGTPCSPLKLTQVTAGAVKENGVGGSLKDYTVGFVTSPGSFLIEAVVEYSVQQASFNVSLAKIVRASKMNIAVPEGCKTGVILLLLTQTNPFSL